MFNLYNEENKISDEVKKCIYKIIVNNFFLTYPDKLNNREKYDSIDSYNNWNKMIDETPNYYILTYSIDNEIVGFIAYRYMNNKLCLSEVQIVPEYQGVDNTLKKMLGKVIDVSNKTKYEKVCGTINPKNSKSINVFSHIGMINVDKLWYEISLDNLEKWLKR